MTTPPRDAAKELLPEAVSGPWLRFLDVHEPLRPVLYRYCRSLTRSPWDADDLVQDTMARAFVTLACMSEAPPNPRAWLFRIASNLWIDVRREREEPGPTPEETTSRVETAEGRLSRVRNYFYTPDVIAEICGELDVPFRVNGYRYWPAPT